MLFLSHVDRHKIRDCLANNVYTGRFEGDLYFAFYALICFPTSVFRVVPSMGQSQNLKRGPPPPYKAGIFFELCALNEELFSPWSSGM